MSFAEIIVAVAFVTAVSCKAYDDGKYSPQKYNIYDDGKYYRPLDEGKYIPGDEGRYTYIYINTLYPAFPYKHIIGPSGGNGGEGGFGPNGPDGPDFQNEQGEIDESKRIQYIGKKIYAERFPYVHKVINALVDKYVSTDNLFGDGSTNHFNKIYADKETAVKCKYLTPNMDKNDFVTQYPPRVDIPDGEKLGSYYSFKGTKILNTVENALKNKIKLEYEVYVRVVDEVTE